MSAIATGTTAAFQQLLPFSGQMCRKPGRKYDCTTNGCFQTAAADRRKPPFLILIGKYCVAFYSARRAVGPEKWPGRSRSPSA